MKCTMFGAVLLLFTAMLFGCGGGTTQQQTQLVATITLYGGSDATIKMADGRVGTMQDVKQDVNARIASGAIAQVDITSVKGLDESTALTLKVKDLTTSSSLAPGVSPPYAEGALSGMYFTGQKYDHTVIAWAKDALFNSADKNVHNSPNVHTIAELQQQIVALLGDISEKQRQVVGEIVAYAAVKPASTL